ncbi:hypothetical protein [Glycomyces salinus]|uniref:hypothetical protein n=1 Tax=Glycomyces salinus TaxID=980294 RepID=UPI0018ECE712|nr:hypothetical protein [Glycomyces salinus]
MTADEAARAIEIGRRVRRLRPTRLGGSVVADILHGLYSHGVRAYNVMVHSFIYVDL